MSGIKAAGDAHDRRLRGTNGRMGRAISLLLVAGVALSGLVLVSGLALLVTTGQTGYHEALAPALLLAPISSY